jgi:hypothetical protein
VIPFPPGTTRTHRLRAMLSRAVRVAAYATPAYWALFVFVAVLDGSAPSVRLLGLCGLLALGTFPIMLLVGIGVQWFPEKWYYR